MLRAYKIALGAPHKSFYGAQIAGKGAGATNTG
jgi:hypothetical protein